MMIAFDITVKMPFSLHEHMNSFIEFALFIPFNRIIVPL